LYVARLNVIRAIRDLPEPPRTGRSTRRVVFGALITLAGVLLLAGGVAGNSALPALIGPAVAGPGLYLLLSRAVNPRILVSVVSVLVLAWSIVCSAILKGAFDKAGLIVFVAQGVILTAYAVALVTENQTSIGAAVRKLGGGSRNMRLRLGLAYPLAKRFRTGLTLAMYAIVVFFLTLLLTISHLFGGQLADFTHKLAGNATMEVESNAANPVPAGEVRSMPGVAHVAQTSLTTAQVRAAGSTGDFSDTSVIGFDESFVGHGSPPLKTRPPGVTSDDAVYRSVLADPTAIIVSPDFGQERHNGPPGPAPKIGSKVTVRDTVSGKERQATIAGIVEEAGYNRTDHVFVSSAFAQQLFGPRATGNQLFITTAPGTDNNALTAQINGRYVANGADAQTFEHIVNVEFGQQQQFFRLIEGYVALGLLVGIAGLGVVMVRAVRERRREVGILRSLGFSAAAVRGAFLTESSFIAVEGILIGAVLAEVTVWQLVTTNTFGNGLSFSIPWLPLGVLLLATLAASLLATSAPAVQASRIRPAVALRIAD
jgi:putative ABC transport system permease protein